MASQLIARIGSYRICADHDKDPFIIDVVYDARPSPKQCRPFSGDPAESQSPQKAQSHFVQSMQLLYKDMPHSFGRS